MTFRSLASATIFLFILIVVACQTREPGQTRGPEAADGAMVVAEINGRRLLVGGAADGWVYALNANTGEKTWEYQLSKRGVNVTPVVVGTTVYVAHSEENVDEGTMGRVVALDATGSGDITANGEVWRANALGIGFSSPLYHDGHLYFAHERSDIAYCLNAATGEVVYETRLPEVGGIYASPVLGGDKLYYLSRWGGTVVLAAKPGEGSDTGR